MVDFGLVLLGKTESLAAMPLERSERKLANEAQELEHKFGKFSGSSALELGKTNACPDIMFGGFGKQGKKNPPDFERQRVWRRASPAFATLKVFHHGYPIFLGKFDNLLIEIAWAVFKVEERW